MNEYDQLFEIAMAQRLLILSSKIECLRNTSSAKGCEECLLNLLCRKRGADGKVVGHDEAVIVLREIREGKDIEDFVWEGRDNGGLGKEVNGALRQLAVSPYHYHCFHRSNIP